MQLYLNLRGHIHYIRAQLSHNTLRRQREEISLSVCVSRWLLGDDEEGAGEREREESDS